MKKFVRSIFPFLSSPLPRPVRIFKIFERRGIHVMPVHFYSPVPDTTELYKTKDLWNVESDFSKVNYNVHFENELSDAFLRYRKEYEDLPSLQDLVKKGYGPGYGEIEALIHHCFIRYFKPKTIIEVGSGISTFFSSNALSMNLVDGTDSKLICIEPFPYDNLKSIPGIHQILEEKVQNVPIDFFQKIEENDVLFIDSSHSVKIGSDVNYLLLDILPNLRKGVLIHIHDIPFPYLYPSEDLIFNHHQFWQEAVLLKALLMNNSEFEIIFCSSFVHYKRPELLQKMFSNYDREKHFPSSIWLKKIS